MYVAESIDLMQLAGKQVSYHVKLSYMQPPMQKCVERSPPCMHENEALLPDIILLLRWKPNIIPKKISKPSPPPSPRTKAHETPCLCAHTSYSMNECARDSTCYQATSQENCKNESTPQDNPQCPSQ